jgi:prevent-host-death family protein
MAAQVEIEEAKSRLDELFARVKSGEEITFAEKGRPVAMLRPAEDAAAARGYGCSRARSGWQMT